MKGVLAMDGVCPTVAKAAVEGFDLDAMRAHMLTCARNADRPLNATTTALQGISFHGDLAGAEDDLQMAAFSWAMCQAWKRWQIGKMTAAVRLRTVVG